MPPAPKTQTFGLLLMLGAGAAWGGIGPFTKLVYAADPSVTPLTLALFRIDLALVTYLAFLLLTGRRAALRIKKADLPYFALFGFSSITLLNLFYLTALTKTSIANAALLLYTAPAFVAPLAYLILGDRLPPRTLIAVGMAILGVAFVTEILRGGTLLTLASTQGDLLALGAGFAYATLYIFSRVRQDRYDEQTTLFYAVAFGALFLTAAALPFNLGQLLVVSQTFAPIVGLGLLSTALPYVLYAAAIKRVEATKASIAAIVEPLVAILLGNLLLGEQLSLYTAIGGALILGSILMISLERATLFQPKTRKQVAPP